MAGSPERCARAAERAGYKKWWLAPHVTESVTNYLEQDFDESVVADQTGSKKAVQSVLQVIGYADVAGHFCAVPPPGPDLIGRTCPCRRIWLRTRLLRSASFALREALEAKVERLEICDAHSRNQAPAVREELAPGLFRSSEEVVNFVRKELDSSSGRGIADATIMTLFERIISREIPAQIIHEG